MNKFIKLIIILLFFQFLFKLIDNFLFMAQERTMVILLQYLRNTFKAQAGFLFTNAQNIIIEILDKIFNVFIQYIWIVFEPLDINHKI
jgi:hypothetical protein